MQGDGPLKKALVSGGNVKIYLVPNILTACNLFCGFVALTKIVEARIGPDMPPEMVAMGYYEIKVALAFILLACIFDILDGRVARMVGTDSAFGRELDSLADLISFGVVTGISCPSGGVKGCVYATSRDRLVHCLNLLALWSI